MDHLRDFIAFLKRCKPLNNFASFFEFWHYWVRRRWSVCRRGRGVELVRCPGRGYLADESFDVAATGLAAVASLAQAVKALDKASHEGDKGECGKFDHDHFIWVAILWMAIMVSALGSVVAEVMDALDK